ncbi:hypothetical protein AVEN_226301-1 [Araneus ventricosus]|uniref:Uncharacterized protein n=1 Tax=Araneus ventricosus TaxID=182803 RepID=A0A4Y2D9D9_ARAVE|nr:hypothetical protein AVEN_226301-1 [Araneus ventricosus]
MRSRQVSKRILASTEGIARCGVVTSTPMTGLTSYGRSWSVASDGGDTDLTKSMDSTGESSVCSLVHRDKVRYPSATKLSDTVYGRDPLSRPTIRTWYTYVIYRNSAEGRGGLMARSRRRSRRAAGSKRDSNEDPSCLWAWCMLNLTWANVLSLVWCGSLERNVPAEVSSSSSDRGSKL